MIGSFRISFSADLTLGCCNYYPVCELPSTFETERIFHDAFSAVLTLLEKESSLVALEISIHVAKKSQSANDSLNEMQKRELLSKREKEVLRVMLDGLTNKEIAQKLFISYETVKSHRKNILSKTGSKNTAALLKNLKLSDIEELKS